MAETLAAIVHAFLIPGEAVLSLIGMIAPRVESIMRIEHGAVIYPLIFSLIAWTLIIVAGLYLLKSIKNAFWQTNALIHTFIHWVRNTLGNLKTRLLWQYRRIIPHTSSDDAAVGQEEFDRLDLAVLRFLFRQGPGSVSSAPEFAEQFSLRPVQVQKRLDKLAENQMLRSAAGSTKGFGNYRLTDSGLTFITMMQRQARVATGVNPVSASGSG